MTRHLSHLRTSSWSWGPGQQKGLLHVSENGVLNPPNNFLKKGKMTINHWPHLRHSVAGAEKARCRPCFGGLIHGFIWRWGTSNSNRLSSSSPLKWPFGGMPHFQTHARTQTHISCHIFLFIFSCTSVQLELTRFSKSLAGKGHWHRPLPQRHLRGTTRPSFFAYHGGLDVNWSQLI